MQEFVPTIGLEVHAELDTHTKMFCGCLVVEPSQAEPNSSICPVCTGMPGTLPVINRQAVEHALRVALALHCDIAPFSLFARKNYFYPDLPKGYQISQYEYPLATGGQVEIVTPNGHEVVSLRRVHLEEDTGKLTHITSAGVRSSLVDLNRAGVALLEIVTEPVLTSVEAAKAYAIQLRAILRYLHASSGDMEKGAIRFEANLSMRRKQDPELGKRVEIKNLNSFKAMEKALCYEIDRQTAILSKGGSVDQETLGWDETRQVTLSQRSKEEAHDYRYFPEPDLPPLIIDQDWLQQVRASLPELPGEKINRFQDQYQLTEYQATQLCMEPETALFFENVLQQNHAVTPHQVANWILGELYAYLNQNSLNMDDHPISPSAFATIIEKVETGVITRINGKQVLLEVLQEGKDPVEVIQKHGFSDRTQAEQLDALVLALISESPTEVASYRAGKSTLLEWFLGQAMRKTYGKADPAELRALLQRFLNNDPNNNQ